MRYESPKLLRYGSFRDLTQAGWSGANDHLFFQNISGCNLYGCPPVQDPGNLTNTTGGSR
jgi:hypothetical protein